MKKIVIIGGGFAGAYAARELEDDFKVVLIDSKDYFEFTPSVLRTLVEPKHARKIQVRHSHYLDKAKIVKDEAIEVDGHKVVTKHETFEFDYLIICAGSRYNTPIKEKNMVITARADELRKYAAKLKDAETVLVIGGGVVGTELAAEVIEAYPTKKVTVIHSRDQLLGRNPQKVRTYARKFLQKRSVEIRFNEKVVSNEGHTYITNKRNKIHADIAFMCVGITPNYEAIKKKCSTSLDDRNYLCVEKTLLVKTFDNVFAAGDIAAIYEEKTAQSAERQASIVVKNIYHLEKGEKLEEYASIKRPMLISLGKKCGMFIANNFVLTGYLPGLLKQFVEWKTMRKYK
jgi:apoptosis-inducing factor 2